MDIECPHCGAKHSVEQGDFGRTTKCLGCNRQFIVNHGFVCSKDGTVTWFASDQLAKMKKCAEAGVWVIIVGCVFLIWADSVYTAEETGLVLTDIEFIVVFAVNLIKSFLSWQGILGLLILVLGLLLLAASKTRCSQCSEHDGLIDLNSPIGWKLYNTLHPNEKQCRDPHGVSRVQNRRNHVATGNDCAVKSVAGLVPPTAVNLSSDDDVIRFVNLLLYKGLLEDAREIRIVRLGAVFGIQYLIGDKMVEGEVPEARFARPIISRIKDIAGLIAPDGQTSKQTGTFELTYNCKQIVVAVTCNEFCDEDESVVLKIIRN